MLLVVAHPRDEGAHFLTDALRSRGARLMVPRDLSIAGWRHYSGGSGEEWAVVSGERVHARDIRGAVVRLPLVRDRDLPHIDVCDREYAAAEMNSFLIAWLTGLSCPVLNRPTAASLLGPDFSHERWLLICA